MINTVNETLYRLSSLNKDQEKISYQLSTGEKINYGSDDSSVYTQGVHISDKVRVFEGLKKQIEKTNAQNSSADASMEAIKKLMDYVKVEVLKALNGGTDSSSKEAIAINIEGVKDNLFMMANEEVEGEYIFAGSNTTIKPFEKDANGVVSYNGDSHLRRVAIEYNEYRDKGVTGFDMMMYSNNTAYIGDKLTFTSDERILDQDRNEWKLSVTNLPNIGDGILTKHNDENMLTNETKAVTQTDPATATTTAKYVFTDALTNDGEVFEAKHNLFDDLDKIVHALRDQKSDGNPTSDPDESRALLSDQLDSLGTSFDGINVAHAKLGGRNKVFDISYANITAKLTHYNIMQVRVSAVDLSKVAMEAKSLEMTYTALYSTISKMNSLSLVNFLK